MPESLRQALRTETRPLHQKLDESVGQMQPFESSAGYVGYLLAMGRLHSLYETSLDWTSKQTELAPRSNQMIRLAEEDARGVADSEAMLLLCDRVQRELEVIETPSQVSLESRWGAAYVMEGSALGAKHLVARVRDEKRFPCSFLEALAAGSQTRWPGFIAGLEGFSGDAKMAVEAAKAAFETSFLVFRAAAIQVEKAIQGEAEERL